MERLPVVDARTLERVLVRLGFSRVRQKGSHVFYRHPDGRTTTIPYHRGRDLARPLLREILREVELTPQEFRQMLEELRSG
ncbi:type II toxin-antitoxin system HicA family toxin [Candidatus Bipolaricaulota bacterium]|nr:type II toxin-antitoxin system HicA family toxin [Candidatus Bipolaricaulota bacterium]